MSTQTQTPGLDLLEYLPYLDNDGDIDSNLQGKIGIYAIFDSNKQMQYVGYSRDVYLSLKQHLIRQPQSCYWVKVQTIDRPSRKILEEISRTWIAKNGVVPVGNGTALADWNEPIDAKPAMTEAEKAQYRQSEPAKQIKILKQVARRVEAQILQKLSDRGANTDFRFNPKLKEKGLLDLK
jgi:hypothetical protein